MMLSTQTQINHFREITGSSCINESIEINDNNGRQIFDLTPLVFIECILGDLWIFDINEITEIAEFNKLTRITGSISIQWNEDIRSIGGFNQIIEIGQALEISSNPELIFIAVFKKLEKLAADYLLMIIMAFQGYQHLAT